MKKTPTSELTNRFARRSSHRRSGYNSWIQIIGSLIAILGFIVIWVLSIILPLALMVLGIMWLWNNL